MKKFMVKNDLAMSQWNLGSFSNLGDWDPGKNFTRTDCAGGWLFAPPVLRCQLVGAGCVTFQNRLSLTIQAHPDLTTCPNVAKSWLQNWIKEIDMDLVSMLELPEVIKSSSPKESPQYGHPSIQTASMTDSRDAVFGS